MSTQLPINCPKCNFKLAPMVLLPSQGNATNVLNCMNCGWGVEISAQDTAALNAANEGVSLNDRQWELILCFMTHLLTGVGRAELFKEIHKELAAIHVRSSHSSQPSVSSMPEGPNVDSGSTSSSPPSQLDLEQST